MPFTAATTSFSAIGFGPGVTSIGAGRGARMGGVARGGFTTGGFGRVGLGGLAGFGFDRIGFAGPVGFGRGGFGEGGPGRIGFGPVARTFDLPPLGASATSFRRALPFGVFSPDSPIAASFFPVVVERAYQSHVVWGYVPATGPTAPGDLVFENGFELGSTTAWSETVP